MYDSVFIKKTDVLINTTKICESFKKRELLIVENVKLRL